MVAGNGNSNERYRRVIDSAPYAYAYHRLITDRSGTPVDYEFVEVNPAFEKMVGIPSESLIGKTVTEVLPGIRDGEFDWVAFYGEVTLAQTSRTFEQYSAPLDRWYHVQAQSPEPGYFSTIFFDITEQKHQQQYLSQQKDFLSKLIQNLPDGFVLLNSDGAHVEVNQRFTEMLGYTQEDLAGGTPPFPYWPEQNQQEIAEAFTYTKATGGGSFELDFRHKDGTIVPVQVNAGAITDIHGQPVNYFATIRDMSLQRRFEKRLQYRLELQRTIAEVSSEFVAADRRTMASRVDRMLAAVGTCLEVDRAYIFEFSSDRQHMSNTHEWRAEGVASVRDSLQEIPLDTLPWWSERILSGAPVHVPDRNTLPREAQAFRTELEREQITSTLQLPVTSRTTIFGFLGFDITGGERTFSEEELTLLQLLSNTLADALQKMRAEEQMIAAREQAEAASRAKSDFLARMSHEIRTPMNAVIGFTDLLLTTRVSDLQRQYLNHVHTSAGSLLGVIDDILDFSKIEAGKLDLERTLVDLPRLIETAVAIVVYRAYEKGLELILDLDPDLPHLVYTDLTRLHQVITNLLTNAVKFTERGEVELIVRAGSIEEPGRVSFAVRDTGPGVPRKDYKRIFESFAQADQTITRRFGGTGLGLPISKYLVEQMGGTLTVDSTPGVGSRFEFTVPFEVETVQAPTDTPEHQLSRVLIAETNPRVREVLTRLLGRLGIECLVVSEGEQLLSQLHEQRNPADAVFIDHNMGDLDGIQLSSRIRQSTDTAIRNLPLVLMHSPTEGPELRERCDELGIHLQLVKPVRPSSLYELIESLSNPAPQYEDSGFTGAEAEPGALRAAEACKAVTLLIAEDNRSNAILAEDMMQAMLPNARIFLAANGREAIEAVRQHSPDLVLMDIQMPELDGVEATRVIREEEYALGTGQRVPILALTAGVTHEERSRAMEAGMDGEIVKPITIEHTREILSQWLPEQAFAETARVLEARRESSGTRSTGSEGQGDSPFSEEQHTIEYATLDEFNSALTNRGYRPEMIEELISLLRERVPELIDALTRNLSAAAGETELAKLARDAHAAKGILNSIDMNETGSTALEAERAARAGETATAERHAHALLEKLKQLSELLH